MISIEECCQETPFLKVGVCLVVGIVFLFQYDDKILYLATKEEGSLLCFLGSQKGHESSLCVMPFALVESKVATNT